MCMCMCMCACICICICACACVCMYDCMCAYIVCIPYTNWKDGNQHWPTKDIYHDAGKQDKSHDKKNVNKDK